jgi:hypothetical protein
LVEAFFHENFCSVRGEMNASPHILGKRAERGRERTPRVFEGANTVRREFLDNLCAKGFEILAPGRQGFW